MDVLIEVLSIKIVDWFTRALIVFIIYSAFKDFIVSTFSSWKHTGFKGMTTSFLLTVLIIVVAVIVLGFGLANIIQFLYGIVVMLYELALVPIWKLITR